MFKEKQNSFIASHFTKSTQREPQREAKLSYTILASTATQYNFPQIEAKIPPPHIIVPTDDLTSIQFDNSETNQQRPSKISYIIGMIRLNLKEGDPLDCLISAKRRWRRVSIKAICGWEYIPRMKGVGGLSERE
jgi:hypothetical protein